MIAGEFASGTDMVAPVAPPAPRTISGAWRMLCFLIAASTLSLADRTLLATLVQPIKAHMHLTDTQFSYLQGFAFIGLYSLAAFPIGMMVDRFNRVRIIGIGVALWSAMTICCGLSSQYWQLFLSRMGVGLGEATLLPATYSLLTDSFSIRQRGLASGLFTVGALIGNAAALMIGGSAIAWLAMRGPIETFAGTLLPWQQVFIGLGAPGLLVGIAICLLPEPPRRHVASAQAPWSEFGAFLGQSWSWLVPQHLASGFGLSMIYGSMFWIIAFLIRVHGWTIQHAGMVAGATYFCIALIGVVAGGRISDLAIGTGRQRRLIVCAAAMALAAGAVAIYTTIGSPFVAVLIWAIVVTCATVALAVAPVNLQEHVPDHMRGIATALFYLVSNILGLGCGTTLVALASDRLFPWPQGLRWSLALVGVTLSLLSAILFVVAAICQRRAAQRQEGSR